MRREWDCGLAGGVLLVDRGHEVLRLGFNCVDLHGGVRLRDLGVLPSTSVVLMVVLGNRGRLWH